MYRYTNNEGLSWDTGPTLISLPNEIQNTFEILKKNPPHLIPLSTGCRLVFSDGTDWILPKGEKNLIHFFKEKNPILAKDLSTLMKISSNIFKFAERHIFHEDPPSSISLSLKSLSSGLIFKHPKVTMTPYSKVIDSLIKDKNLREFFYHFSSYVGMSPDIAQGGILSIAHVELNSEVVFPKGGVYSIAEKLYNTAIEYKVKFYFNSEVLSAAPNSIENQGWNLCVSKENVINNFNYDIIVSNADPYVASEKWIKCPIINEYLNTYFKHHSLRPSESQFVILFDWKDFSPLTHHIKIFPKSWKKSFLEVCEKNKIPNDPCIYLVWPHATDKSISPRILFVSAMAPNNLSGIIWNEEFCGQYAKKIMDICREKLNLSFNGDIFKTISPLELECRTKSYKGGIYSATSSEFQPMSFHFSGITKIPNLFFVGGGVHPGAGVTMVMKSANRIANHIVQKFNCRK